MEIVSFFIVTLSHLDKYGTLCLEKDLLGREMLFTKDYFFLFRENIPNLLQELKQIADSSYISPWDLEKILNRHLPYHVYIPRVENTTAYFVID